MGIAACGSSNKHRFLGMQLGDARKTSETAPGEHRNEWTDLAMLTCPSMKQVFSHGFR